ncbi:class I SAM-dependent methyltransferase [Halosolutus halophilus]|uniref:class I SAM-dependent methyltransferase n=1 Tax=Halosolutus halophilus TaxID=1552990 RepID=UPI00223521D9|nr:class I SAM-dependent methyltransferase [Halosolutus halophilus]
MFEPRYNFGLYHWRRRLGAIAIAAVTITIATVVGRRTQRRSRRIAALLVALVAAVHGFQAARRLGFPAPWAIERYKYDALAARLPLDEAARVLDIGCGTGRSLVGLAPHVPNGATVIGLDVFDDRVILGNAPQLAKRNADRAGLAVEPVVGDAATLPLRDDSVDVATACRVLHDLPASAVDEMLRELRRVCTTDGTIGVLELPLVPDGVEGDPDPERYWTSRVTDADFEIRTVDRLERTNRTEPYVVIVASPDASTVE